MHALEQVERRDSSGRYFACSRATSAPRSSHAPASPVTRDSRQWTSGDARGQALERGSRPLPGRRDHEGRPVRVLRPRRGCADPAPARPAVHDEALARGAAGRRVLPEAGAEGDPVVDRDARVPHLAAWWEGRVAARRLPARQLTRGAALDGADALHRHERVVLARRQAGPARLRAVRSRPARGGRRVRALHPRRALRASGTRRTRARLVCQDERLRRHPRRRADRASLDVRGHVRLRGAALAATRGRAPGRGDDRVAEEEARQACSSITARTATARRSRRSTRCVRSRVRRSRRRSVGTS